MKPFVFIAALSVLLTPALLAQDPDTSAKPEKAGASEEKKEEGWQPRHIQGKEAELAEESSPCPMAT